MWSRCQHVSALTGLSRRLHRLSLLETLSVSSYSTSAPIARHWITSSSLNITTPGSSTTTREYSQSRVVQDRDKDPPEENDIQSTEEPHYQIMNNTEYTEEELDQIFKEEEAKYLAEQERKLYLDWKPGQRKKPRFMTRHLQEILYELEPGMHPDPWTSRDIRCGALALKVGMMPIFDDWGERHPCTVLHLDRNVVMGHKTLEKHGYWAVQVAVGERKRKNVGKCLLGQYKDLLEHLQEEKKSSVSDNGDKNGDVSTAVSKEPHPPFMVREFRVSDPAHLIPVHSRIHARHFVPGQNIDVSGITKGKGFQGAMKKHHFAGMPASHGTSLTHRALGSVGSCQDPGRVFKGKKMAGRMGNDRVTTQNLRIVRIDRGRNLIFVKGSVPGNKGSFVEIRDAIKRPLWMTPLVQGELDRPPLPTFQYDESVDGCGKPGFDENMPLKAIDPLNPELTDNDAVSI
jgi:large subunit ribosomal protein L3